jgi:hypothetical protein
VAAPGTEDSATFGLGGGLPLLEELYDEPEDDDDPLLALGRAWPTARPACGLLGSAWTGAGNLGGELEDPSSEE